MDSNQLLLEKIIKDFNDYQAFEKIAEEKIKEGQNREQLKDLTEEESTDQIDPNLLNEGKAPELTENDDVYEQETNDENEEEVEVDVDVDEVYINGGDVSDIDGLSDEMNNDHNDEH